jgi:hypothetical protein
VEASRSASTDAPDQAAVLPLATAVRELFSGLRAGAADVADLVAAEAQVALRLLTSMVLAAVGAALLAVFALGGLMAALAALLMEHGIAASEAIVAVALLCAIFGAALMFRLRVLTRRVLFARSRGHLRGEESTE